MHSLKLLTAATLCLAASLGSVAQTWPTPLPEAKPGTRWWWLGSAVDRKNLEWNLGEYARTGLGAVEITPIYGVQGNEANDIDYLSPRWMDMLRLTEELCQQNGIEVDMNNGTGWPFGGPQVPLEEAACKVVFADTLVRGRSVNLGRITLHPPKGEWQQAKLIYKDAWLTGKADDEWRVIGVFLSHTFQKVKRAAPGGDGWVIDHFSRDAVRHYLDRFDKAFAESGVSFPHTFFNDSYEVFGANWTPRLFEEFHARRGYRLEKHLPELLGFTDDQNRTLYDYRLTLAELLEENFTQQWVAWAHSHGAIVRNQAHGSPANLLDLYATVDIPEIESFGLSDFGIKGLRRDPGCTKKNDSDAATLKLAASAAHIAGKPFTSSETFTWLSEHFRTSLSQMKPDLDLMFTCGVNHVFFHGTTYSPKDDPWPGWKFYATTDMSPTNSVWRDAGELMRYIERSQSFLQWGQPDNDFLLYLPVYDAMHKRFDKGAAGLLLTFDIHSLPWKMPEVAKSVQQIDAAGYDCDYVSDRQLSRVRIEGGALVTEGGTRYKGLIIPAGTTITPELEATLNRLAPYVVRGEDADAMARLAKAEPLRSAHKLRALRRSNDKGHHYFIANLTQGDVEARVPLAVAFKDALWFNPMDGTISRADIKDGQLQVCLRSGESRILQTFTKRVRGKFAKADSRPDGSELDLTQGEWQLSFTEEAPRVAASFCLDTLQTWETLPDDSVRVTMGTGVYSTHFTLDKAQARQRWQLDLGDVRESARVYINGQYVGTAWAVPFTLDCGTALRTGVNELRIEVTNLPANRIADMDRRKVPWRKMKEINMVDINYWKTTYDRWAPVKSGLASHVRLIGVAKNK